MLLTRRAGLRAVIAAILDVIVTACAFVLAILIRHRLGGWSFSTPEAYGLLFGILMIIQIVSLGALGCYRRRPLGSLFLRIGEALALSHLLLAIIAFYAKAQFLSRGVVLMLLPLNFAFIMLFRAGLVRLIFGRARPRVLIVGSGRSAASLARALSLVHGNDIIGFVGAEDGAAAEVGPILGPEGEIERVLSECTPVDIVAIPADSDESAVAAVYGPCRARGTEVMRMMDPPEGFDRTVSVEVVGGGYALIERHYRAGAISLLLKRLMDIVGAVFGLLLIAPFLPLIALLIKLTSKGPVFFRQPRRGLNGCIFNLYKFRTMVEGAAGMRNDLLHLNEARGPHFKIADDPRLTAVGRFLRRTSLDEFPQFWNVLKGDMSLVGPRPLPLEEVETDNADHCRRLVMRPGITGFWQTRGRGSNSTFDEIVKMDDEYIRRWSIWLDLWLILKTVPAVLLGHGAN